jgi:hypothetical protein
MQYMASGDIPILGENYKVSQYQYLIASVVWWSRIPLYRSRSTGSIPGATRFSEK